MVLIRAMAAQTPPPDLNAPVSDGAFKPGDQWVAEQRLPLWLIRAYEEGARRESAAEAARGAHTVLGTVQCVSTTLLV